MIKFLASFDQNKAIDKVHGLHSKFNILYDESMAYSEKEGWVLYLQGSLFNVPELSLKYQIHSASDAEMLLAIYLKLGIKAFTLVDGNYTLILRSGDETIIFRDRHGAGAQVYYSTDYFTNSLSAFSQIEGVGVIPNKDAIYTFLELGYIPSPMTSLEGVNKLPAGNLLSFHDGKLTVQDLYSYEQFRADKSALSEKEAMEQYEQLHKQAIRRRIAGRENVALLLSGGYDSGGNISALREVYSGKITGFSVGFKDNPWTEVPLAKIMADQFDADFYDYTIDGSEIDRLPQIVDHLGDPFQEAGMMVNYCAMRMVAEHRPDVILGGDGNDQHFGTFGKEAALNYRLRELGFRPVQELFSAVSKNEMFENDNILFRARFHNEKILHVLKSDSFGFKNHQFGKLLSDRKSKIVHSYTHGIPDSFNHYDEMYAARNYFVDLKQVVNEVILFKASKMAELYNNHITFPYMDTDIYNFLKTMPREFKLKGSVSDIAKGKGVAKYLHKAYLKPRLPREITQRKKQGGFAPLAIFFNDENKRAQIKRFVINSNVTKALFNAGYVTHVFDQYNKIEQGGGYWFWYKQVKSTQLFNLLVIAIWWEIMIEGNKRETLSEYLV